MMWGWLRASAVRASRLKRSTIPSPMSRSVGARTLIATLRSRARSWARYTVAIPPWPTAVRISYCPRVARRSAASCACAVSGRVSTTDPGGVATVGPDQGRCTGMPVPQRGQKAVPGPRVAPQRVQVEGWSVVIPAAQDTAIVLGWRLRHGVCDVEGAGDEAAEQHGKPGSFHWLQGSTV